MLEPFTRIWKRIENSKTDSDVTVLYNLLYACEQMTKIVALGLIACLEKDHNNSKYFFINKVVRADGLGDWASTIDDILYGPASHFLCHKAEDIQKALMEKVTNPSWQYGAVFAINQCLIELEPKTESLPVKVTGGQWFMLFARLRNKTRGHGVISTEVCTKIVKNLETSLKLIENNFILFNYSWAYLYRNLSGKYRVSQLSSNIVPFEYLKEEDNHNFENGIYLYLDRPRYVELFYSTADLVDFFFPNGFFTEKKFDCISYITGAKDSRDSKPYLNPTGPLPSSETEGSETITAIDNCFSNVPTVQSIYINRNDLELELKEKLMDDRYPIVTLIGRGGIGKTSLALSVIKQLCKTDRFDLIVWFSARDIDLLETGSKPVKPKVLNEYDIANEYVSLMEPEDHNEKSFDAKDYFEKELGKCSIGCALFVMDNFETLRNPTEVYKWLDTYIRLPNKILITSRFREFKADYPIEVKGMKRDEFNMLVKQVAIKLNIDNLITNSYIDELFTESAGHPYVAKVLIGEISKARSIGKVKRIIAGKEDMLTALFERTYTNLSPAAKRVFLTLCNWRTYIPRLAVEAILIRECNEYMDVEEAIDELYRYSLIDLIKVEIEDQEFTYLPLSSFEFGKKNLNVSSMKASIEADTEFLMIFGPTSLSEIKNGIRPKIRRLFKEIATNRKYSGVIFDREIVPILTFICRRYNSAWLNFADLYEDRHDYVKVKECLQNYLRNEQQETNKIWAWEHLSVYNRLTKDWIGEAHSIIELCEIPNINFVKISGSASRLLQLLNENKVQIDTHEKTFLIKRLLKVMAERISEGDNDDKCTLAWLYINLQDLKSAKILVREVLNTDPGNFHLPKLVRILRIR